MQREAFLNFIGDYPLVIRTFEGQYPCDHICERAMVLTDEMEQFSVPAELTALDRAILKASVEKNDWLEDYPDKSDQARRRRPKQLAALRDCASRLESIGIEVDHIPI